MDEDTSVGAAHARAAQRRAATIEIDYGLLNTEARFFYNAATKQGYDAGRERQQHDSGVAAARSMLEVVRHILSAADEPGAQQRHRLAWLATVALGKVPLMNVSERVHGALDALARQNREPSRQDVRVAYNFVKTALDELPS